MFREGFYHGLLGQSKEAIGHLQRSVTLKPDDPNTRNSLGFAYYDAKRFDESAATCLEAIKLRPGYIDAYNNLGLAYHELQRDDDAIDTFRKAISLDPSDTRPITNLGGLLRN